LFMLFICQSAHFRKIVLFLLTWFTIKPAGMTTIKQPKLRFDTSGYYFMGLIAVVILGFWPSYFAKFLDGTANFKLYFHFHAIMVTSWLIALIVQPILIRKKKLPLHRLIGKFTYFLFPLMFISVILLAHSRIPFHTGDSGINLLVPFKDLFILAVAYFIAIRYRHNIDLHARGMVATGIVFIEPALSRAMSQLIANGLIAYLLTILIIYSILIALIIIERKQKKGRWVFPLILGLYIIVHSILIFDIHIAPWETFAKWFAALPIT